jgi:hypothetical protein
VRAVVDDDGVEFGCRLQFETAQDEFEVATSIRAHDDDGEGGFGALLWGHRGDPATLDPAHACGFRGSRAGPLLSRAAATT